MSSRKGKIFSICKFHVAKKREINNIRKLAKKVTSKIQKHND